MDLNELIERERIRDVIYGYCEAIDAKDWQGVLDRFTPDAMISHGRFSGPFEEFMGHIKNVLNRMEKTVHIIGGTTISIEGERAQMSSSYVSFHSISGKYENAGPVKTGGIDTDWQVAGRYVDQLLKVGDVWKIYDRKATTDWTRVQPSSPTEAYKSHN